MGQIWVRRSRIWLPPGVPDISEWDVEQLVSLAGPADRAYSAVTRETLRISTPMASIDEEIARIEQAPDIDRRR